MGRTTSLWSVPSFRGLWVANAAVNAARGVGVFTISVAMINVLGASPFEAGLAAPLGSAGPLLFGLFAGVLVDRWGQRRTMLGATWVRMLAYGWAVAAFALGWLAAWQMLVVILVISVADVFSMAAHTSVLPKVVGRDRVPDAVSSLMATDQVLALTAPALGGQLVRLLPAPIVLAVSAIGQGIAGFGLRKLPPDAVPVEGKPRIPMGEAIRDGLRFMTQHKLLLALMLTTATNNAAAGVYTAAQSWFVLKDLRMSPELFGLVWSISAIGGIGGALVAPKISKRIGPLRAVFFASLWMPVNFALIPLTALVPHLAFIMITTTFTIFGFVVSVFTVNSTSTVTALTPDDYLARVAATRRTITQGSLAIGGLVGATLLAAFGAAATLWVAVGVSALQSAHLLRMGVPRRGHPRPDELPETGATKA